MAEDADLEAELDTILSTGRLGVCGYCRVMEDHPELDALITKKVREKKRAWTKYADEFLAPRGIKIRPGVIEYHFTAGHADRADTSTP